MSAITSCKECGSTDLSWQTHNRVDNGVQQNRLNTNDVTCVFVLGCNACSETLAVMNADKVAASMNADLGKPQAAQAQPYALDGARYVAWRGSMLAQDQAFIDAMTLALPADVGLTRKPTADEWDAAIDKAAGLTATGTPA